MSSQFMATNEQDELEWVQTYIQSTLESAGYDPDRLTLLAETDSVNDPTLEGVREQGFRLVKEGETVTVTSPTVDGQRYGLLELAERVRNDVVYETSWEDDWTITDAPAMEYRGYCLGLQRPTAYYDDHRGYDWPITPEHFPWFYDRDLLTRLLDHLAKHKANALYLWSGHPFASLVDVTDEYPAAPEVDDEQLEENIEQYQWLCAEAEKRGIWIIQQFYNIHMSDPLAKERGWDVMSGRAHPGVSEYTYTCIEEFARTYPSVGLMPTMGEVLAEEDAEEWLIDVIIPSFLDGLRAGGNEPNTYPPLIVRAHATSLDEYLEPAIERYPALSTIMKHNNEDYSSTQPDPGNTVLARMSGSHVINLHCASNMEPFSWGSPRYIHRTVRNMNKADANGVHVYPLRYWDYPNSSRVDPTGDQLHEHFVWWSAWSRYAWDPNRDEENEDCFWQRELARHYDLSTEQADALFKAKQKTGPVLPQIASQFTVTSGNRQANPLGLHLVTLAFSNREYLTGRSYGMPQMCGFPVLGEDMWVESPANRMGRMQERCEDALESIEAVESTAELEAEKREIEAMDLIAEFYERKAKACALYFQDLYGVDTDIDRAESHLEESVEIYRDLVEVTNEHFRDAASLHHHRNIPASVTDGYYHWEDVLELFEAELEIAREEGLNGLLEDALNDAAPVQEYYEGVPVDEV